MGTLSVDLIGRGMGLVDDADIDGLLELLHPEIEWRPPAQGTLEEVYHGHEGVTRLFEQLTEAWDSIEHDPIKVIEGEDETVVITRLRLHAQASDLLLDEVWAYAIEVRDEKMHRVTMYTDPENALQEHSATAIDGATDWPG